MASEAVSAAASMVEIAAQVSASGSTAEELRAAVKNLLQTAERQGAVALTGAAA